MSNESPTATEAWPLLISQGIRAAAERQPYKIAMRVVSNGAVTQSVSYSELIEQINQVSQLALTEFGLRRGDHVAIASNNSLHYIILLCGFGAIGVVAATPNPSLSAREIAAICDDAEAQILFCSVKLEDSLRRHQPKSVKRIVPMDAALDDLLKSAAPNPPEPNQLAHSLDDAVLPYTSGTTGLPKGVRVTQVSRSLTICGMGVEYGCFGPDDHFVGIAPMCHGAGFAFNLAPLYFGGTCDLMTDFDPQVLLRHLAAEQPTGIFMVPTHFRALFAQPEELLEPCRENRLKAIISNAAPLSQPLKERIVDVFGEGRLHECYGSTEAGIVTSLRPQDQLRKKQCVGLPFVNTQIRLLDTNGEQVSQGDVGELYSRSPYLFAGYWQKPEETSQSFRDGWVSAGDLARQDDEGYYYIVDRKKDMIISGGINIYPKEIESVLDAHPDVAESAVYGVPDEYWGERVVAAVVVKSGSALPSDDEFQSYCREHLGSQKIPKSYHQLDALPRNPMGKVLKTELRSGD